MDFLRGHAWLLFCGGACASCRDPIEAFASLSVALNERFIRVSHHVLGSVCQLTKVSRKTRSAKEIYDLHVKMDNMHVKMDIHVKIDVRTKTDNSSPTPSPMRRVMYPLWTSGR